MVPKTCESYHHAFPLSTSLCSPTPHTSLPVSLTSFWHYFCYFVQRAVISFVLVLNDQPHEISQLLKHGIFYSHFQSYVI